MQEDLREKVMELFHLDTLEVYDTFWKKFRGLMFSRAKNVVIDLDKECILGAIIHMFFVFYSLDVYWLNNDLGVVDTRKKLKPFFIAIPKKKARYILEMPS